MRRFICVDQLAHQLCMTRDHIYRLCRWGKLPHTRINGWTIRFDAQEIDDWINEGRRPAKTKKGAA